MCALMRQTWYESAKAHMNSNERLMFYEACFDYEFYQTTPPEDCPFSSVRMMFDMCKDAIDADRDKAHKIAMRNRRNGMLGGRPPKQQTESNSETQNPDETQRNPDETQKTQEVNLGLPLHYTTQHNTTETLSLYAKSSKIETETLFFITLFFFANGATNAQREAEKFYNHYQARGWRVGKDVEVYDKVALAKNWRIDSVSSDLVAKRAAYVDMLTFIRAIDMELINDFADMIFEPEEAIIYLKYVNSNAAPRLLESKYIKSMEKWFTNLRTKSGINYRLEYLIRNTTK